MCPTSIPFNDESDAEARAGTCVCVSVVVSMTDGAGATVLVVEDQEGLGQAYAAVLSEKYSVRMVTSGEAALEEVDDEIDVILLDRRMPGMSGDEVLAELQERDVEAKIAMLTAVEPTGDIVEMPFDNYVTKPIDNDELLELVDHLLSWKEYGEQTQEFLRLGAKKIALESADRERTEQYRNIVERMEELHREIDESVDELDGPSRISGLDTLQK